MFIDMYIRVCICIVVSDKVASPATFPWRCDGQASRETAGRSERTSRTTPVSQRLALRPSGDQVPTLAESQGTAALEIEAVPR